MKAALIGTIQHPVGIDAGAAITMSVPENAFREAIL